MKLIEKVFDVVDDRLKYISAIILALLYFCFANLYNNIPVKIVVSVCCIIAAVIFVIRNNKEKYNCIKNENDVYELIHDLKTPVIAQLRVTEHLANGAFGALNDSQKEIVVQLNNSSRYLSDIVNNFLLLCRVKHDNITFQTEKFDINDVIKQCIADLKYISSDKRCSILFDYSQEQIFVNGAKTELKRVVMNILTNAVNYSYPNRVITTCSKISNDKYIFEVNSFGDYIEKDKLKNICCEYKTLKKSGTGLGLYICEIILNKHKSNIFIKSDRKTGNSFGFKLPLIELPVHK